MLILMQHIFILQMASLKILGNETAHREQLEFLYRLLRIFFKTLFFRSSEEELPRSSLMNDFFSFSIILYLHSSRDVCE